MKAWGSAAMRMTQDVAAVCPSPKKRLDSNALVGVLAAPLQ